MEMKILRKIEKGFWNVLGALILGWRREALTQEAPLLWLVGGLLLAAGAESLSIPWRR